MSREINERINRLDRRVARAYENKARAGRRRRQTLRRRIDADVREIIILLNSQSYRQWLEAGGLLQ